jgi:thiamine pyrophosphokinase
MNAPIVEISEPVVLVGGGTILPGDLEEARAIGGTVVAADGGANALRAAQVMPQAVIGDMDSLDTATGAWLPADRLHRIAEQDSTDFDKALRHVAAPLVIGLGFLGGRVDHQLAAFHVLARHADRAVILLAEHEVLFHLPPEIDLPLQVDDIVSLFPVTQVRGRSSGLVWPIDGIAFDPVGRIGTSNRATGPVRITMDGPGMLAVVPRACLAQVAAVLQAMPPGARWPVRQRR